MAERDEPEMLIEIAACGELFHTAAGTAFADLLVDGHRETPSPIFWSMVTGKLGPSVASAFEAGCVPLGPGRALLGARLLSYPSVETR